MDHAVHALALSRFGNRNALAVSAQQRPRIAHLPATRRIEDRAIELDAAFVHRRDLRARSLQIGVVSEQQFSGHRTN